LSKADFLCVNFLKMWQKFNISEMKKLRSVRNLLSSFFPSKNERTDIHRIIILLVLCGCQNWSVTLRMEQRLWVFENRALRNMLGSKVDGGIGGWNKLHSDRFCELYYL